MEGAMETRHNGRMHIWNEGLAQPAHYDFAINLKMYTLKNESNLVFHMFNETCRNK